MNQHRPVPAIGRGPQAFTPREQPPIQNPMMPQMNPQPMPFQMPESPDDLLDLAMEIYSRLAIDHISHNHAAPNAPMLRELANSARIAAQAFFKEETDNAQA